MNFTITLYSVLSLCALALPGFILMKLKILKSEHIKPLVSILLFVCQPFLMVNSFLSKTYEPSLLQNMGYAFLLGMLSQIIMCIICKAVFMYDKNKLRANTYVYAATFGNVGFMGIPVISVLMPKNLEALLYVSIYILTFNLLCWTLGVYIITGKKSYISIKKAILNPPMIAFLIAIPFFFFKVQLPGAVLQPIEYLANMNTPIAMIILGMRFSTIKFKELFTGFAFYICLFLKLILCPLLVYLCLFKIPIDNTLMTVAMILSAMPSANMVLMMSEQFEGDTISATKGVMGTTLFSIITIPLMLLLIG